MIGRTFICEIIPHAEHELRHLFRPLPVIRNKPFHNLTFVYKFWTHLEVRLALHDFNVVFPDHCVVELSMAFAGLEGAVFGVCTAVVPRYGDFFAFDKGAWMTLADCMIK